jgi:hypothetical protein
LLVTIGQINAATGLPLIVLVARKYQRVVNGERQKAK